MLFIKFFLNYLIDRDNLKFQKDLKDFYKNQKKDFPVFKENYFYFKHNFKERIFNIRGIKVVFQFNPKRAVTTKAKVDKKSIAKRKCFLCKENLFEKQKRVVIYEDYGIQSNPYPIFERHFTIVKKKHVDQQIFHSFIDMLSIAKKLHDICFVFYNGPQSGASAPDHLHFQAAKINSLPVEKDFSKIKRNFSEIILNNKKTKIFAVKKYLRNFLILESRNKKELNNYFQLVYKKLQEIYKTKDEPKMNVICFNKKGKFSVLIFPRTAHRPDFYYFTGKKQILLSPGTTDMGGLILAVRDEDFKKTTKENIEDMYKQISISDEDFETFENSFKF